ncbi:MAG: hypothetical protein R3E53_15505 [Myxococcota bacterium]
MRRPSRACARSRRRASSHRRGLEDATRRNGLVDVDARQKADAPRDVYLERASLGLTEEVDPEQAPSRLVLPQPA